tara:strand:- start:3317 stop:3598 length:282 start_codon:yes stop_codon:yes gene_type:complete
MTKQEKLTLMQLRCEELYNKIADAFHNQSGGDYNDTMYYQWLGASEEMEEAQIDNDIESWQYAYKTLSECWKYVEYCKKIDDLQQNMPDEIYC